MPEVSKAAFAVAWALKQVGKEYRLGAEVVLDPQLVGDLSAYAGQKEWDCSEFCQASPFVAGVTRVGQAPIACFDGASEQYRLCPVKLSVAQAAKLPGALLFMVTARGKRLGFYKDIGHVGMVIAPGYAVEARGTAYGVVITRISDRGWTHAAKIPELYT